MFPAKKWIRSKTTECKRASDREREREEKKSQEENGIAFSFPIRSVFVTTPGKFSEDRKRRSERKEPMEGVRREQREPTSPAMSSLSPEKVKASPTIGFHGREREVRRNTFFVLRLISRGKEYINIFSLMMKTRWFGYRSPILQ